MGSGGTFPSPIGVASGNLTHPFHPAYPSYNGCPLAISAIAPFTPSPFVPMTQMTHPENLPNDDPSSTTVFVAGLPACITEETLKIPPNKGYGFVKYAKREDAKQAIIKMNDFPIHEKSRLRLSWGRSLGDKKVEYVKKLSSTLGISFESVWKIVQGQDPTAIKQIVSTVCGRSSIHSPPYTPSNLPPTNGLDPPLYHLENFNAPEFTPVSTSNAIPTNLFPSVLPNRTNPGLATGTENFPSTHTITGERTDQDFRKRSTAASCKPESSLPAMNPRPKALSHGSGSASLPPPSWAMRHSWQELFPNGNSSQPVESPTSSVDGIRFPEVPTSRRATIPSVKSPTFPQDHCTPSSQSHHGAGSPGSALLSSSQASSMDSLDASSFGLRNAVKDYNIPVVRERDEYELGCDGFLHELLEEEGRKGALPLDHPSSAFHRTPSSHNPPGDASVPDLSVWSAPSFSKSSPLSERDSSDWPRTFLVSKTTSEIQSMKNIFDSAFENSTTSQSPQIRETDDPRSDQPINPTTSLSSTTRLDTWSFPSYAGNSGWSHKPLTDPSPPKLSPALDTGIKSLDNFYTLSL
ncbi:hypothetical protein VP01_815g9 [Puccinia sorghi]|uniref:RRM domain-containing protein n=1 Tax=Puccinia sorghi TaxID=27349 RepID=A0A0L6UA77_9BASI|nr:hypothetical protein VP01_815g9 [Puccinia sorghi]